MLFFPLQGATPNPAPGPRKNTGAKVMTVTGAGRAPNTLSVTPAITDSTAATVPAATARTLAARKYSDAERGIDLGKRENRHGEETMDTNPSVLERKRIRTAPFWSRRPWGATWRVWCNAGLTSSLSGGPGGNRGRERHVGRDGIVQPGRLAFVSERDRAVILKRYIPHIRSVWEAERAPAVWISSQKMETGEGGRPMTRYIAACSKGCCCCSHINSHNQVRGHRTGSSHSGAEGYPREKHTQPKVVNAYITAGAIHASTRNI